MNPKNLEGARNETKKLTFDSVFSKNFFISPQLATIPVNISTNNANFNNYNINSLIRKSNTSNQIANQPKKLKNIYFVPNNNKIITYQNNTNLDNDSSNCSKSGRENMNASLTKNKIIFPLNIAINNENSLLPKISNLSNEAINSNSSLKKKINKITIKQSPQNRSNMAEKNNADDTKADNYSKNERESGINTTTKENINKFENGNKSTNKKKKVVSS